MKAKYSAAKLLSAMHFLFHRSCTPPHVNLTKDEELAELLNEATDTPDGGDKLFGQNDVKMIMDGRNQTKDELRRETDRAVDLRSFGAPWFWVTNERGESEPFFGSDR